MGVRLVVRLATLGLAGVGTSTAHSNLPNFIFYQPDEMRADVLGTYGGAVQGLTPNFDAFVEESAVRFEQPHVSYTVCTQSRVAFATGWPTHVHGYRGIEQLLHSYEPNLFKYLKNNSYEVQWWGKNDMLAWDSWQSSVNSAQTMGGDKWGDNLFDVDDLRNYSMLYTPVSNDTSDMNNLQAAISWLKTRSADDATPFMLYLPLSYPHPPYSCPEPWYSSIDPDTLPPLRPHDLKGKPDYHALIRQYRNFDQLSAEQHDELMRKIHAVYLGCVSYSDHLFGLLRETLKETGLDKTTATFVFADHGDYAGDYGLVEKWPSGLDDILTRVPLLISLPEAWGGVANASVAAPVQVFDIVPTVLELANISAEHTHFGESLVPFLQDPDLGNAAGAAVDAADALLEEASASTVPGTSAALFEWPRGGPDGPAAFAEGGYSSYDTNDFEGRCDPDCPTPDSIYYPKVMQEQNERLSVCRAASIRTATHKLVYRSDFTDRTKHLRDSELYDLVSDPLELDNLYNSTDPQLVQLKHRLYHRLMDWLFLTSDVSNWAEDSRYKMPGNISLEYSSRGRLDRSDLAGIGEHADGKPIQWWMAGLS